MSKEMLIMFISFVLVIYAVFNGYVFWRSCIVLTGSILLVFLRYVLLALILAYPLGRILEKSDFFCSHNILITIGSIWLAALTYLVLSFVVADLIFLGSRIIPALKNYNVLTFYRWWVFGSYILTAIIVTIGYFNALHPVVREIDIAIQSESKIDKKYRMVFISDIHLGAIIGNGRLKNLVQTANAANPDLILLGGDTFDEDLGPVIKNNMGDWLKELNSRLGKYAVTGNHEYIGGADSAVIYLSNHGIKVLEDSLVLIDSSFVLAGRKDFSASRFGTDRRKSLAEILEINTTNLPVILLDHQPNSLAETIKNKVALQLSGHTHHGQLWPFNYITQSIFTVSRGLKKIGNSWIFVSTGYGTWGPPVRIGNRPELVIINLSIRSEIKSNVK